MNNETMPGNVPLSEWLGQPASAPKPRGWAIFVDSGNARMWGTLQPHVQKIADAEGLEVVALYDQSAIDAAVAAAQMKWMSKCAGKRHEGCNYLAHCGMVCNKCGQVA